MPAIKEALDANVCVAAAAVAIGPTNGKVYEGTKGLAAWDESVDHSLTANLRQIGPVDKRLDHVDRPGCRRLYTLRGSAVGAEPDGSPSLRSNGSSIFSNRTSKDHR